MTTARTVTLLRPIALCSLALAALALSLDFHDSKVWYDAK